MLFTDIRREEENCGEIYWVQRAYETSKQRYSGHDYILLEYKAQTQDRVTYAKSSSPNQDWLTVLAFLEMESQINQLRVAKSELVR